MLLSKFQGSDSGVYVCQAEAYQNYAGSQVRVSLDVDNARKCYDDDITRERPEIL